MIGLQTARVVVVDDEFSEVEALLRGLSNLRIGALYFNGDNNELPSEPLAGVRLVFLDLHLLSASGGGHTVLANTIGVLAQLVPAKKGETGIICWTKHPEEKEEFEEMLRERFADMEPAFVLALPKKDFISTPSDTFTHLVANIESIFTAAEKNLSLLADVSPQTDGAESSFWSPFKEQVLNTMRTYCETSPQSATADLDALRGKIEEIFGSLPGSRLVWEWEQAVHDAATSTTSLLHEVACARRSGETREKAIMTVLSSLAIAAGGSAAKTPGGAVGSLFEGVNPIHADFLDQLASSTETVEPHHEILSSAVQASSPLTLIQSAQTNAAILTGKIPNNSSQFQPGNLYLADAEKPDGCPHALCKIEKFELGYGLLKSPKNDDWNKLNSQIKEGLKNGLNQAGIDTLLSQQKAVDDDILRVLLNECLSGVVEVTPACDYASKKFMPAKFVSCLIVPNKYEKLIRSGDFIRRIKPMTLHTKDGIWHLLLNSRFMFGVSNPFGEIKTVPLLRIRLPLLIDIQAWLAAQGARPGYISV